MTSRIGELEIAAVAALLLVAGALLSCRQEEAAAPDRLDRPQSIILISLDTLRADMMGAYGYRDHDTSPFLDSFASESILFENCIIQEPRTLTSHMSLLTGLFPHNHGVDDERGLSPGIPTLPLLLQGAGYRTQAFVDGGFLGRQWGFAKGFAGYRDKREGLERILKRARGWLKANGDQDFFLFLHSYDVHSKGGFPYYSSPPPFRGMFSSAHESSLRSETKEEFRTAWKAIAGEPTEDDRRYIKATYAEGIRHADSLLEEFFAFLETTGVYERALIVVWSDHGEGLLDHGSWSHGQVYDHTIRVPLIVRIPGRVEGGRRIRSVVSAIDIAPTILELAGVAEPPPMDGRSVVDLLAREEEDRVAFTRRARGGARKFSLRTLDRHLILDEGTFSLFDVTTDPLETQDLFSPGDPAAEELRTRLLAWIREHDDALAAAAEETPVEMDEEVLDSLRALGYVN